MSRMIAYDQNHDHSQSFTHEVQTSGCGVIEQVEQVHDHGLMVVSKFDNVVTKYGH